MGREDVNQLPVMSTVGLRALFPVLTCYRYCGRVPNYKCLQACHEPHDSAPGRSSRDQFHSRKPSRGGSDEN